MNRCWWTRSQGRKEVPPFQKNTQTRVRGGWVVCFCALFSRRYVAPDLAVRGPNARLIPKQAQDAWARDRHPSTKFLPRRLRDAREQFFGGAWVRLGASARHRVTVHAAAEIAAHTPTRRGARWSLCAPRPRGRRVSAGAQGSVFSHMRRENDSPSCKYMGWWVGRGAGGATAPPALPTGLERIRTVRRCILGRQACRGRFPRTHGRGA